MALPAASEGRSADRAVAYGDRGKSRPDNGEVDRRRIARGLRKARQQPPARIPQFGQDSALLGHQGQIAIHVVSVAVHDRMPRPSRGRARLAVARVPSTCGARTVSPAMLTTAACCATVEIINPARFVTTIVIFVRSMAS
jgi:hypothetical protein